VDTGATRQQFGGVFPQRFGTGVVHIAACEADIREHPLVTVRKARELTAMPDGHDELPDGSRQGRGSGDRRGQPGARSRVCFCCHGSLLSRGLWPQHI